MDENLTPIIVAVVGVLQVVLVVIFARRKNKASAKRDEAGATLDLGSSYSTLVGNLEARIVKLEKNYSELCDEYETSKAAWAIERIDLVNRIKDLERINGG